MIDQLDDGSIDVFAFAAGAPVPAFVEIEAKRQGAVLRIDRRRAATLKQVFPELSDAIIPRSTYKALAEDLETLGIFNVFITHKDLPEDLAYRITRIVLENNAALVKGHPAGRETRIENWERNTFLPFHPGAVRSTGRRGSRSRTAWSRGDAGSAVPQRGGADPGVAAEGETSPVLHRIVTDPPLGHIACNPRVDRGGTS